jgi:hypothetical protein
MAPGGRRWSESPIPRWGGRRPRVVGEPSTILLPIHSWEFGGVYSGYVAYGQVPDTGTEQLFDTPMDLNGGATWGATSAILDQGVRANSGDFPINAAVVSMYAKASNVRGNQFGSRRFNIFLRDSLSNDAMAISADNDGLYFHYYQDGVFPTTPFFSHIAAHTDPVRILWVNDTTAGTATIGINGTTVFSGAVGPPQWPASVSQARMFVDSQPAAGIEMESVRFWAQAVAWENVA